MLNMKIMAVWLFVCQGLLGDGALVWTGAEKAVSAVHHRHRQSPCWRFGQIEDDHCQKWARLRQVTAEWFVYLSFRIVKMFHTCPFSLYVEFVCQSV